MNKLPKHIQIMNIPGSTMVIIKSGQFILTTCEHSDINVVIRTIKPVLGQQNTQLGQLRKVA